MIIVPMMRAPTKDPSLEGSASASAEALAEPSKLGSLVGALIIGTIIIPAWWIFPTVFAIQVRNLINKKTDIMTRYSYLGAAFLLVLYLWTDVVLKGLSDS